MVTPLMGKLIIHRPQEIGQNHIGKVFNFACIVTVELI